MSKTLKSHKRNIDDTSRHLQNKIKASTKKSRTAGKQNFKKQVLGNLNDEFENDDSIYNW